MQQWLRDVTPIGEQVLSQKVVQLEEAFKAWRRSEGRRRGRGSAMKGRKVLAKYRDKEGHIGRQARRLCHSKDGSCSQGLLAEESKEAPTQEDKRARAADFLT